MERLQRGGWGPKLLGLLALIKQHHSAVETDLHAAGLDLLDLYRGNITARKVAAVLDNLPPDSATRRAVRGGPHFSVTDLLAEQIDALWLQLWQGGGNAQAPRPKPFPRPGDEMRLEQEALAAKQRALQLAAWQAYEDDGGGI